MWSIENCFEINKLKKREKNSTTISRTEQTNGAPLKYTPYILHTTATMDRRRIRWAAFVCLLFLFTLVSCIVYNYWSTWIAWNDVNLYHSYVYGEKIARIFQPMVLQKIAIRSLTWFDLITHTPFENVPLHFSSQYIRKMNWLNMSVKYLLYL